MNHPEHDEQVKVIQWASKSHGLYPELELLFALPNAAKRSYALANYLKAEGMRPGIPDLFLPSPKGKFHGLFIEMKSKNGKISDIQKWWHDKLSAQGYLVWTCYGFNSAKEVITMYLNNKII